MGMLEERSMALSRRKFVGMGALADLAALAPGCVSSTLAGTADFSGQLSPPEVAGMSRAGLEGIRAAILAGAFPASPW